jgi:general nucleoside transport system ATP-binding protein
MSLLALNGVSRRFGAVQALDGVHLTLEAGEVHALVGENGAGKSTLVKIVAGLVQPDAGEVLLDDRPVRLANRRAATALGIGVVHQHFSLVETMTVAENLLLGRPDAGRLLAMDRARRDALEWGERTGLAVAPDRVVADLSVGERQRVEILTALAWGAKVLLLDEPTAVLSPDEADSMLDVVRHLAADGLGVLLVTHKLREVELLADRVTVLRGGVVVGRHDERGVSAAVLAAEVMGTGRALEVREPSPPRGPGRLEVRGLGGKTLRDVDLTVHAGEVLGIAGVAGNGQSELLAIVAGLRKPTAGTVQIDGRDVTGNPRAARRMGLAFVPEDRAADGLALGLPVWANAVAKRSNEVASWRGLDRAAIGAITDRAIRRLGVRPANHRIAAGSLSGGNQQRLVVGRELDTEPGVIVVAEPTRGLDPGSARDVIVALRAAARGGAAVLVIASDLDELLDLADTVVVLYEGAIRGGWDRAGDHRADIGHAMVGVGAAQRSEHP